VAGVLSDLEGRKIRDNQREHCHKLEREWENREEAKTNRRRRREDQKETNQVDETVEGP